MDFINIMTYDCEWWEGVGLGRARLVACLPAFSCTTEASPAVDASCPSVSTALPCHPSCRPRCLGSDCQLPHTLDQHHGALTLGWLPARLPACPAAWLAGAQLALATECLGAH
jgi:hypothetical protein